MTKDAGWKNDIRLVCALLALALLLWGAMTWFQGLSTQAAEAAVTVDGELYGRFSLGQDRTEIIELPDGSFNVLTIAAGEADMTEASCPDQICVNHSRISKMGESIVCLPNKVVVTIENGAAADVDAAVD